MLTRLIALAFCCCMYSASFGQQNPFMTDANGRPLFWTSNFIAEGSPYFHEEYNWAEVTTMGGTVYKDVRVKFNVLDRELQYLMDDGKEMVATTAIKSIRFLSLTIGDAVVTNVLLQSDSGMINKPNGNVYQVLASGRVSLMKKISITTRDEKKYGEASTTRHFDRKETDYVISSTGEMIKLEKNRSFITNILNDKRKEIDAYIDLNKIKCKSIKDFQQIVSYYNSLT